MKKFLATLVLGLVLLVTQPANVLKAADVASDILKKTLELTEKQKIKGKKLEEFILNNVITVDYDGKKQSYKFNKDITYEVYEGKKVVDEGTWAIKGFTKSSIKLSGNNKDIYFQIYKDKDRISTLTNLKKKNDEQTNRKILRIVSKNDFSIDEKVPVEDVQEEQVAQVEPKEEKKEPKEEKKKKEEKKQLESSQDTTAEDVSVKKNIKYKTKNLRNNEFYTKDFIEDKIIDNFIALYPCMKRGANYPQMYQCDIVDPHTNSMRYANFALRKPYNLHWYMPNYGGTRADKPHSEYIAIYTSGKNWALYKDPRWKVKHNQKVCEPDWDEGGELKKEDCVDGVSVLTFDISFIKGRGKLGAFDKAAVGDIAKPYFNTGLGEYSHSKDNQEKGWRKKLSFVFKKNNSFYKKVNTTSLFLNPILKSQAFMYAVVKVGDPLIKELPEFEDHYISYNSNPLFSLMVSIGLDEKLKGKDNNEYQADTLLTDVVFDVVENGKRSMPGTSAQDIAKKWEELSILGEDLKKCLNDNKTDFDKLENCSKSYEKSTRKIIDWKENQWNHEGNKGSIFNLAIVKLFPPKNGDTTSITRGLISDVQSENRYEIEPIEEGVRSFWTVTACIEDEVKKVEYETDLDIISILEQNCFQLLDKNIAFNKEISQKLKEVKVIKKTKKEKRWIGIKYEEVSEKIAIDVGLKSGENPNDGTSFFTFDKCETPLHCGVIVKRVYEDSPADKAGIKVDDVILQYNGKTMRGEGADINLRSLNVFEKLVDDTFAGQEVSLEIWRNKNKLIKKITLGKLEKRLDYNAR